MLSILIIEKIESECFINYIIFAFDFKITNYKIVIHDLENFFKKHVI